MKTITYTVLGFAALAPTLVSACIFEGSGRGYGMMGYNGGAHFLVVMGGLVWTGVGILAGVWLWQHISKK